MSDHTFRGASRALPKRQSLTLKALVKPLAKLLPILALFLFGTLLLRHIWAMDQSAIWHAVTSLAWWQWLTAILFTALSFRAIGVYDVLVHRVLQTGENAKAARSAGVKAIAISQTLGFGAVTSALVRWRCLPTLPASAIARLSAVVSLSFLASLAAVAAIVVPLSGLGSGSGVLVAAGLGAIAGLMLLARLAHRLGWIPAPLGKSTLGALLAATTLDTACAACALWVLWPEAVSFHLLFAAYLVALGAGLVSNAPGGVGAFDLSVLALLPVSDDAAAMAALLAFRVIYYGLPAAVALVALMRPTTPVLPEVPATKPKPLQHPEASLSLQTAQVFHHPHGALLTLPCWGTGAILGDLPAHISMDALCSANAPRAFYKCSARQAAIARASGWRAMRCADDAILCLNSWTTVGPKYRQLRRALKSFASSSLQIQEVENMQTLRATATAWADQHGGERGHSMGRFCPDYLQHQRVFAAFDQTGPVAFVSFHTGRRWTLDLMRHRENLPKGTMHALVCAGICAARAGNATTLSLAAVPALPAHLPFAKVAHKRSAGLRRFKSSFAPNWQPRYACAPHLTALGLTLVTLAYAIHRPPKPPNHKPIQRNNEDYSFAPVQAPCEAQASHLGAGQNDQCTI